MGFNLIEEVAKAYKGLDKTKAIGVLEKYDFTPGISSTRGMDPLVAALIKAACQLLAREAAEELIKFIAKQKAKRARKKADQRKAGKKTNPRRPEDVKPRRARKAARKAEKA